jgi:ABC-type multidrug transport system fused ATPase/permease subunit
MAVSPLPPRPAPAVPPPSMSFRAALAVLVARLSLARRRGLVPLMLLMLAGAFAELVTIGALLPFLGAIANPATSSALARVQAWFYPLGIEGTVETIYLLTVLFAFAALAAAAIRLLLLWTSQKYVFGVAYELSVALYATMLHQPYSFHIKRNSSETIAAVNKVQAVTGGLLMPLVQAVSSTVIAAFVVAGLVVIDPSVALVSGAGFALIYLAVTRFTRARLRRDGVTVARAETQRVRILQEGLGGIRDVLLDHSQPVFIETYERIEAEMREARTRISFFAVAPRYLVEAMGIVLIAGVAVMLMRRPGGFVESIPLLGALALGAQRLLPLIQQIYAGWAMTMGNRRSLVDLAALLDLPAASPGHAEAALPFRQSIAFERVGFAYADDRRPAVSGVTLTIPKGARVGLVGRTGSGKSTLMDLLIGLLDPREGAILIDGERLTGANRAAWQKQIAHVPQFIYLADASVAENIAFGVRDDAIDIGRARQAAEQAELTEVIATLPRGFDTLIGERGVQLSGGQRQRLGIARALYRRANVLVFDEATSALDTETETAVMSAIEKLSTDLTIVIIAHRLSTVAKCDMIVRLEEGRVVEIDDRTDPMVIADGVDIRTETVRLARKSTA